MNVENSHKETSSQKNEQIVEYKQLKGTPFTLVRQNEDYFLVMGDNRLTEPTKTEEETMEKLESEKWMIIFTVVAIVSDKIRAKIIGDIRNTDMTRDTTMSINDKYNRYQNKVERAKDQDRVRGEEPYDTEAL